MRDTIADLNKTVSLSSGGHDPIRAAKLMAAAGGDLGVAQQMAKQLAPGRVADIVERGTTMGRKGAVAIGGLSDALAWYQPLAEGFFGSMSEFSALAKIYTVGDFFRIPLRTLVAILTTAPVGAAVSELGAKPMTAAAFASARFEPLKTASIICVTNELARSVSQAAMQQISAELRRAASIAADSKMLSVLAATSGITSAASTGVTASAILSDLTTAIRPSDNRQ